MSDRIRILYDATYATKGNSGIPNDCRSTAEALTGIAESEISLLASPKEYVPINRSGKAGYDMPTYLGATFRRSPGRSLPFKIGFLLNIMQAYSPRRKIGILKLTSNEKPKALSILGIGNEEKFKDIYIAGVSLPTRFARPSLLRLLKLNTRKQFDFFIQQQIDPISVPKSTKHVIRLHDILPITHPEHFDQLSVRIFLKGFTQLIARDKLIWVMDTQSSVVEFKRLYGDHRKVFYVPCTVEVPAKSEYDSNRKKKKRITVVNTIEPRKRTENAINSFLKAKKLGYLDEDYELFIVGSFGWLEEKLFDDLRNQVFGKQVIFKENLNHEELRELYASSKFVLSCSAAEGFGLPPIEGMAFGCVPIVSDIPQHRENIEENGIFFPSELQDFSEFFIGLDKKIDKLGSKYRKQMQQHVVKNFSKEIISEKWSSILESELRITRKRL
jgi:glycosyltransferase involved in cell wall biosynthesis